jgi:hypothetical protein
VSIWDLVDCIGTFGGRTVPHAGFAGVQDDILNGLFAEDWVSCAADIGDFHNGGSGAVFLMGSPSLIS